MQYEGEVSTWRKTRECSAVEAAEVISEGRKLTFPLPQPCHRRK